MSTGSVKHGLWTDHNRSAFNRHQLLVNDYSAGIITNTVAVLITLMSKVIWALLKNSTDRLWHHLSSNWWNHTFTSSLDQAHDTHEAAMIVLEDFMSGIKVIAIGLSSTKRLVQNVRRVYAAFKSEPGPAFISVLVVLALLAFPVLLLVASIVSAGLATDGIAISQSPSCGYYATRNHSSPFLVYEHGAERRAATYKEKCYGSDSNTDDCTQFFNQSITYTINSTASCPFHGDICATGNSGAYSLSTGLVSGAVLGINAANPYFFNRTMICAPLRADENYIDIGETKQGEEQWEYFYGKGSTEERTWQNPVKESSWEIKGYSTGIFCSRPGSTKSPFVPRSEFSAGPYPVTLLFISSHRILYPRYSDDPVFPAREKSKFPAGYKGQPHYFNNSTRAGVLGCVDQYQICRTELGPCWDNSNINSIPQAPDNRTATEEEAVASLLVLSLDYSTACGSIEFRGAAGLQAQAKIAHIQSLPLALNQWQVESESLFQTSLARIQGNIFDFARGTAAGVEGYVNTLPDNYRGMCQLVKIPTRGWTNINFVGLVGIFVGCLMLFGFSRDSGISVKLVCDGLKLIPWTKLMLPLEWLWQRSARFRKWTEAIWKGIMLELSQLLHRIMTCSF